MFRGILRYFAFFGGNNGYTGRGRQMTVGGLSTTVFFGDLGGVFFGNVRNKTSSIT